MNGEGPCIVQRDGTVLLEIVHPDFEKARQQLIQFAELVKSPASFHTYRITPLSLWNAAALGGTAEKVVDLLHTISRWEVPTQLVADVRLWMSRYGRIKLVKVEGLETKIDLQCSDSGILDELEGHKSLASFGFVRMNHERLRCAARFRGSLKQELTRLGYPIVDEVGYHQGHHLSFQLGGNHSQRHGESFRLRPYQEAAVQAFSADDQEGNGVLVLPCGAGKTVIGLAAMEKFQCETLILTSNVTSVRQWITELLDKTTLSPDDVGEYSGERKEVKPVTVSTYQILTHRDRTESIFKHMKLFNERDWGLIIYDEVHLLPAPVFRATADIQATRRLGLTATLVREDGCERDVFSLIGPKRYEMPWKELEGQGWIAQAICHEIRVPMPSWLQENYIQAEKREKFRLSAENPMKIEAIEHIRSLHPTEQTLIIGQYLNQLRSIAQQLNAPLITGVMPQGERNALFQAFRCGDISLLIVSKVANFAVDLPDAAVAIQISGSFGSRQEEAQRLGRIVRPKSGRNEAFFYTIVSQDSREQDFARRRQLFLIEQGYEYRIEVYSDNVTKEASWG